ncbi:MAG: hypothetical protein IVW52_15160 [Acidimicrobiales bacterium]|nr:hypothetical protein [Acidimicrobiales bacterium]
MEQPSESGLASLEPAPSRAPERRSPGRRTVALAGVLALTCGLIAVAATTANRARAAGQPEYQLSRATR